jgi:hypothetical protein
MLNQLLAFFWLVLFCFDADGVSLGLANEILTLNLR